MSGYHDREVLEGYLKQQCVETDGLITWERKLFELDIAHLELHVKQDAVNLVPQSSVSLKGVKYAKEWSFSNPVAGYGFDMVWFSGKVWSFFADNESLCKVWVSSVNRAISSNAGSSDSVVSSADNERFRSAIRGSSLNNSTNSALNETKMEVSSPQHNFMTPFSAPPTVDKFNSDAHYMSAHSHARSAPKRYEQFEQEYASGDEKDHSVRSTGNNHQHQQPYSMESSQPIQAHISQHSQLRNNVSQELGVSSRASTESEHMPSLQARSFESTRSQQASIPISQSQASHYSQSQQNAYEQNRHRSSSADQQQHHHGSVSSAAHSESPQHLPSHRSSASVASQKQSVSDGLSNQAQVPGYLQFPPSVASTHTAAFNPAPRQSSSRVIEHVLPPHPSGASVNTLQSYHESLLDNNRTINQHQQQHDQASVLSKVDERSAESTSSVHRSSTGDGSTRPPRGHSASQSALSSVIRDANLHAQALHAPSTDSMPSIQRQNTMASNVSVASQRSAQQSSVHFVEQDPNDAHSVQSLALSERTEGEQHARSQSQADHEHDHDHGDLDSEIHHRHSVRVYPHAEPQHPLPSARPPLPPSASRDAHSLHARSADTNDGDDASSFCNSSYASQRFSFPDHESLLSQQPSLGASTTTHNIQQRLLYGHQTGADGAYLSAASAQNSVPPVATSTPTRHADADHGSVDAHARQHHLPPQHSHHHSQESLLLPESAQMSARMDIQRELSAHAITQDRPSVQAFAQEAQALQAK